jgi:hypothetical protein
MIWRRKSELRLCSATLLIRKRTSLKQATQSKSMRQLMVSNTPQHISYVLTSRAAHAEAYARMTRLAAPLQPSHPHPDTPSKKRRRVDTIEASEDSSRYDSLSPRRRSNTLSEAGRAARRLSTPENSRVSAPSRLEDRSPLQANTPKRRRFEEPERAIVKKEKEVSLAPVTYFLMGTREASS